MSESSNDIRISETLKQMRQKADWSQSQLAAKLGVSLQTVWRWENETHEPSALAVRAIREISKELGA